ncbi:MAG: hypothetical protein M1335_06900 [Chloroflexi bacterium]|nr:hypothetical protein [Chloroflexota bacterium]
MIRASRVFLTGLSALVMAIAVSGLVMASGYIAPTPGSSPHGGYSSTTNECKVCHAVHQATGSFRLLRDNSATTECDFCHGVSGVANSKPVHLDQNGHGLQLGQTGIIYAPDDIADTTTASAARFQIDASLWGCASCHSVHNASTIQLVDVGGGTSTKLLKKLPNPNKTVAANYTSYDPSSATQKLANWCSACHNANIGLHTTAKSFNSTTNVYGHDASADGGANAGAVYGTPSSWSVNAADAVNNGPSCKQCHVGDGDTSTAMNFPHSGGSTPNLLKIGSSATTLDGVCVSCHETANLP